MYLLWSFASFLSIISVVLALPRTETKCTSHRTLAGEYVNGTSDMDGDPLAHFDAPMVSNFNLTATEDWSFDGVSTDGAMGISIFFSRGTVAGHTAAQRLLIAVTWPNGTRYLENAFAQESIVLQCKESTAGIWANSTSGLNWTFEVSNDYKHTIMTIDSKTVKGTYTLESISPAVYPNGRIYPDRNGNPLFAPFLYWVENVPIGIVQTNLTILGTPFILNGIGGREHNWNSDSWGAISARWDMVRGAIGPYNFIAWTYESRFDRQTYFSIVLMKGQDVIFRTEQPELSVTNNYGSIQHKTDGPVHLTSDPKSPLQLPKSSFTGYILDLVSPKTKESWRFELDFTKPVYWFAATEDANIGGFVGNATGGLIGAEQYTGIVSGSAQELVQA